MQNLSKHDPIYKFAAAMLAQACEDATLTVPIKTARMWLRSDEAMTYAAILGLDVELAKWIERGYPKDGRLPRRDKVIERDWHSYYAGHPAER